MGDDLSAGKTEEAGTTRRTFLQWLIGALVFINGLIVGVPFLRAVLTRANVKKSDWTEVARISSLPAGQPKDFKFLMPTEDAYLRGTALRSVWVIRRSPEDITVFSPVCTHLGCFYAWNGKTAHFECPCHASVFDIDGKVLGGPAPRPLDTLPFKVENGVLFVQWEQFKAGTREKISI